MLIVAIGKSQHAYLNNNFVVLSAVFFLLLYLYSPSLPSPIRGE
jgi:hypothetical protein